MRKFWKPKPKPKYDLMVKEGSRGSWRYYCYSAGEQVLGGVAFASQELVAQSQPRGVARNSSQAVAYAMQVMSGWDVRNLDADEYQAPLPSE